MSKTKSDKDDTDFFNYTDDSLTCSLSQTIRSNDKTTLQRILKKRKKNPIPLNIDNRGWTALHVAAAQPEAKDCLELLLRYGDSVLIDLDAESFKGETALYIACENGCEENVRILLKKGCDPKKKIPDETSPLHIASMKGFHKIVDLLLDYGININDQDWHYFTPLHLAAMSGHTSVCRILLENGAGVRITDSDGNLPLHLACQNGHFDVVRLLLEHDFTLINFQNRDGITPPMLAVQNHNVQCVRYLLDNGAKTEVCNKDNVIALQFAATGGGKEVLELVLQSTNMTSIEQYCLYNFLNILKVEGTFHSLTCCAIFSGSVECLSLLLESKLPKSIMEAPFAENIGYSVEIHSPLAYLFSVHSESTDDTFDSYLNLLLEHDIVFMKEFSKILKLKWPESRMNFVNPFSVIFNSDWPRSKKLRYFNLLNSKGVTPDYCLQCYNNNEESFENFCVRFGYLSFYKPVLDAVQRNDMETVKLFLTNSQILEPDFLCYYLVGMKSTKSLQGFRKDPNATCSMYDYLIKLKPTYFKPRRYWQSVMESKLSKCASMFSASEEFTQTSLQQLCRTAIRSQVREPTIEGNLLNFRKKINELPLPVTLKDFLLFK